MEKTYLEKIKETAAFIKDKVGDAPHIGVILGTVLVTL